ncbi:hypothetical protein SAMN05216294_0716 [Flagellimonas zhangzhouensis]|uniref:Uncharacterized protein n=1 Tax=Flagellimonas zhangzhouensis TaxID=1073328 RepID=A0A1H2UFY8_9FLAO|nr:hypothetical protein SAMN05216294_0716 [Allomuricauda zhangzhouensis]SDW55020.1 hypothetical protein SAMN04487892_1577 [Allomuricauda zhangzhouensis]
MRKCVLLFLILVVALVIAAVSQTKSDKFEAGMERVLVKK